jgi:hemerythrin-like metal-binding protein
MLNVKWAPDLETGNKLIDSDHKNFIVKINKLATLMAAGNDNRSTFAAAMDDLINTLVFHYRMEDRMLQEFIETPGLSRHVKKHLQSHADARKQLTSLHKKYQERSIENNEVLMTIYTTFVGHIRKVDREFAYLQTNDSFYMD